MAASQPHSVWDGEAHTVPASNAGENLAHIFCHECHGYMPGAPVFTEVTSLCAQFRMVPRRHLRKQLPLCVVCADITASGRCPAGHPMAHMSDILRRRES